MPVRTAPRNVSSEDILVAVAGLSLGAVIGLTGLLMVLGLVI